jgi:integrase
MGEIVRYNKEEQYNDNVVDFNTKKRQKENKAKGIEIKYCKDGVTPKQTVSGTQMGDIHKVYPFKTEQEIHDIITYYENKIETANTPTRKKIAGRNIVLITVGLNIGIRGVDLLSLKYNQIMDNKGNFIEEVDDVDFREQKTGKIKGLVLNESCKQAITEYINRFNIQVHPDSYIFFSTKNSGEPINVQSCSNVLKEAAKACGINRRIGSHTLRKTFSYFQIKAHRNDAMFINELQALLNHSSPEQTLTYCGLSNEKLRQYHHDVNLGKTCVIKNVGIVNNSLNDDIEKVIISKSELEYIIQKALENNSNDYLLEDIINNLGL